MDTFDVQEYVPFLLLRLFSSMELMNYLSSPSLALFITINHKKYKDVLFNETPFSKTFSYKQQAVKSDILMSTPRRYRFT